MRKHVTTPDAYRLWLEGSLALAEVESTGIRIDREYLERAIESATVGIREHEEAVRQAPEFKFWQRRYGDKVNTGSPAQLAAVVFGDLGHVAKKQTKSKSRDAADEAAFAGIDLPILKDYFAAQKLRKGRDTYLYGIRRELVRHQDGLWYVHPHFNLNTVSTFRSSGSSPNVQNQPARNPALTEIIRRCYVARPGHQLVECDFGQIEVRIPCAYHSDPTLVKYVTDPTTDMHRDMAAQIFKLKPKQVSKPLRQMVKAAYVFATFYGSYYGQTAPAMWDAVDHQALLVEGEKGTTDAPLTVREHLSAVGFDELGDPEDPRPGTFVRHIRDIDGDFWGRRFQVYAEWKRRWWDDYVRDGGFTMLTGFAVNHPLDRKQACNSPIQGVAFHCTLWSLIKLTRWLRKYKMCSRVIAEVHDSLNLDVHPAERDDVLHAAVHIMTESIKQWATWLNVPLSAEAEACPIDGCWFDKHTLKLDGGGRYVPADLTKFEKRHGAWV